MANSSSRSPMAGGFLLAISLISGGVIGTIAGEPSLGFVLGIAVGVALTIGIWAFDRARRGG